MKEGLQIWGRKFGDSVLQLFSEGWLIRVFRVFRGQTESTFETHDRFAVFLFPQGSNAGCTATERGSASHPIGRDQSRTAISRYALGSSSGEIVSPNSELHRRRAEQGPRIQKPGSFSDRLLFHIAPTSDALIIQRESYGNPTVT